jgi:hypothetical protein
MLRSLDVGGTSESLYELIRKETYLLATWLYLLVFCRGWRMLLQSILQQSDRDRNKEGGRTHPRRLELPESRAVVRRWKI